MSKEPVRILHYIKHLGTGGGETLLYNIYNNIDREKVQFDFLVNQEEEEVLDSKIKKLGGKKIVLIKKEPVFIPLKIIFCALTLYRFLCDKEYKIIHIHCSNGQGLLFAYIAKRAGIPVRIVHIHNADVDGRFICLKRFFHNICRKLFMDDPTDYFACSDKAARWLYREDICNKKKYILIKNGIEINKYAFNLEERLQMRNDLGWNDKKIIMNVGRLEQEKNQLFLLKVFTLLCKKNDDYRMILIGRGHLKEKIKRYVTDLKLDNKVKLIDYTDRVEVYLWASDLFALPSLKEGLGIAAIEAQASGLITIVSDNVPEEAFVTDIIESCSLKLNAEEWADIIISKRLERNRDQNIDINNVCKAGYDIKETAAILQNFYLRKVGRCNEKNIF